MSSFELNKLSGVSAARALAEGDRAKLELRTPEAAPGPGAAGTAKPGISVEVAGGVEAGAAPVDNQRVAEIRQALREGSYPLVPTRIADAMIAARIGLTVAQDPNS